jgi:uncharacterized protein YqjF (DUF2071 family)
MMLPMSMLPDGFPRTAAPLPGPVLSEQQWLSVAFLHWRVDPALVRPLLPTGTEPDCLDGATYVGLVAFRMHRAGLGSGLPLPWLGTFPETNVRLYSRDEHGHHGVVFRSLEATRLATVLAARLMYRVPYTWARMRVQQRARTWRYRSHRRWPMPQASSDIAVRVGEPVTPTEVEVFLTARWGLHSRIAGRTIFTPNEHEPWPLHEAELLHLRDGLVPAAGIEVDGLPDLRVLWSPGVRSRFAAPVAVAD